MFLVIVSYETQILRIFLVALIDSWFNHCISEFFPWYQPSPVDTPARQVTLGFDNEEGLLAAGAEFYVLCFDTPDYVPGCNTGDD